MWPFLLLLCAGVIHATGFGENRTRGLVTLPLTVVALVVAVVRDRLMHSYAGYAGAGSALLLMVLARGFAVWFTEHEGAEKLGRAIWWSGRAFNRGVLKPSARGAGLGLIWSARLAGKAYMRTAGIVGDIVRALPSPAIPVDEPAPAVSPVSTPMAPRTYPPLTLVSASGGTDDTDDDTYLALLNDTLTGALGYNEGAREASRLYGVSRSTFARDRRTLAADRKSA